jgi:spore coat polysaccharide biosynthesis protein SpsF
LADLAGRPLVGRLIDRMRRSREAAEFIVATSTLAADDPLAAFCAGEGVRVFRGSPEHVLERYVLAAREADVEGIVRVTADNPLTDPEAVDAVARAGRETGADLVDGIHRGAWVHGAGCEFVTRAALERALARATRTHHTEHVTTFLKDHPGEFRIVKHRPEPGVCRTDLFFTVDHPEDLEVARRIFAHFGDRAAGLSTRDVIAFLDAHPEIVAINRHLHEPLPE